MCQRSTKPGYTRYSRTVSCIVQALACISRLWYLTSSTRSKNRGPLYSREQGNSSEARSDKSYLMDRPTFLSTTSPFRASSIHTPPEAVLRSRFASMRYSEPFIVHFLSSRAIQAIFGHDMYERLPFQVLWRMAGSISCCNDASMVHSSACFDHDAADPCLNSVAGSQLRLVR